MLRVHSAGCANACNVPFSACTAFWDMLLILLYCAEMIPAQNQSCTINKNSYVLVGCNLGVCILTSPTIKIQDGRLRPYWKCNFKVNGHRNPRNITFPTKCGIESRFLASFLYFDESKYQNSRWPPSTNSIIFFLSHITYWISHEELVFSNIYLFPDIISCISKFKMANNGYIQNLTPKKIVLETGII